MPGIFPLQGVVKNYEWGGASFIPQLLAISNPQHIPFAEYWMGTHALGTGQVKTAEGMIDLNSILGNLPFLFKVLDVCNMLSIQVHPSLQDAELGYRSEEEEGIPHDSVLRIYKDRNHKPELMVALSDFWLLHGFKPPEELSELLLNIPELQCLMPVFRDKGYNGLYQHIMLMPQQDVDSILSPLLKNIPVAYNESGPSKSEEDYWALKAASIYPGTNGFDRGIFSIYLFNLVQLKKGEAIYQAAGVPHAYLEGQNVEIMANSDNVLRGGLTNKLVAIQELLRILRFEPSWPEIIRPHTGTGPLMHYHAPVSDFQLDYTSLQDQQIIELQSSSAEILLVTEGAILAGEDRLLLKAGQPAALVLPQTRYELCGVGSNSSVFRAFA